MRVIFLLISILFFEHGFAQSDTTSIVDRDSVIAYARQHLGTTYLWGGSSKKGFDCSGFVHFVFRHFGVDVPRTSRGFKDKGSPIPLEEAQPGDVILFTGTNSSIRQIGHVGIVSRHANDTLHFIHSSSSRKHYGVTETCYTTSGYPKRFLKVINILQ